MAAEFSWKALLLGRWGWGVQTRPFSASFDSQMTSAQNNFECHGGIFWMASPSMVPYYLQDKLNSLTQYIKLVRIWPPSLWFHLTELLSGLLCLPLFLSF